MSVTSEVRAGVRLVGFTVGSWLVVARAVAAVAAPYPARWRRIAPHNARWARFAARCLGMRVRPVGPLPLPGSLVVANHLGYLDVVTVGALIPAVFAARHDMRSWPVFGWLAAAGGSIFIDRQRARAGARGVARVTEALAVATVVGFPEGTSAGGGALLPFRSGLFQAAVDAGAPVVPAAVRYLTVDGDPVGEANLDVVGWFRGEPFFAHVWRLVSCRQVSAEVRFGRPIAPPHADRRTLAAAAEREVRALLAEPPGGPEGGSG